jgi:hypothetical protein
MTVTALVYGSARMPAHTTRRELSTQPIQVDGWSFGLPEAEAWLWQNPKALVAVLQGLKESALGQVEDLGSFAQYVDLEIE